MLFEKFCVNKVYIKVNSCECVWFSYRKVCWKDVWD